MRVGGGGVYNSSFACDHLPGGGGLDYVPDAVNTVTWEYSPEEGRGSCTLTVDGHEESRRSYAIPADAIRPGPLDLVISVKAETALTDVLVVSVAYSGFDPREEPSTPVEVAAGHLARGAPDRALAALGGASTEALLPSLIALNRLGRTREVDALLARGVATGALSMEMKRQLLLVAPDRFGAAMRSALGAGWCEAFGEAWQTVVTAHPDEPRTINTLLSGLTGVERSGACGADLGLQAELLLWRTGAYRRDGSLGEAREDAEHAAEIFRREPAMSQALYRAERERALALVAEGDTRAAMDGILAALRVSTSPESAADVVVHTPGLAPLRSLPGWAEIEAFRKLGPAETK